MKPNKAQGWALAVAASLALAGLVWIGASAAADLGAALARGLFTPIG